MADGMSDKAVAVFAFAAYHQLESGQAVTKVVREDGRGHAADSEAVAELETLGLVDASGQDIAFSPQGLGILSAAIDALRRATAGGSP